MHFLPSKTFEKMIFINIEKGVLVIFMFLIGGATVAQRVEQVHK